MDKHESHSIRRIFKYIAPILFLIILISAVFLCIAIYYPTIDVRINNFHDSFRGYTLIAPTADDLGLMLKRANYIYLIDMKGKIVHSWQVLGSVQLAKLKPNGNLLYSTRDRSFKERAGVREIDPFGNVILYYKCWADHDFYPLQNGNILIHIIEDKQVQAIGPGKIRCPRIIEVTPKKKIVWEWRGEEHLHELTNLVGIKFPLNKKGRRLFDWAHNNTCQVIEDNRNGLEDPRFKRGNIIFSYCNLNTIGVIDKNTGNIVWAWGPGVLDGQHSPRMMKNGHIILFDNGTERGYSRIIELNPLTKEITWLYNDNNLKNKEFFSRFLSSAQYLPNGNVFICQSSYNEKNNIKNLANYLYRYIT